MSEKKLDPDRSTCPLSTDKRSPYVDRIRRQGYTMFENTVNYEKNIIQLLNDP